MDVLLAVPELPGEPELVAQAPALGIRVLRRCVDAVDLLAAAAGEPRVAVIVSSGLPRLDRDVLERVAPHRAVLGLAASDADAELLDLLGVTVLRAGAQSTDTWSTIRSALEGDAAAGVWTTGVWVEGDQPPAAAPAGRMLVVWGPQGAPGRTTVAIGVAEALARAGHATCLVDADTYGPSVTMALGIVEETSGLVVACRHADNATLTASGLRGLCHPMLPTWLVLGGVGRPDRWPDVRTGALDRLWPAAREAFDVVVVDVSFCLEADEAPFSSRRNAATLSALASADQVLCVADGTALGAARLAEAWPGLVAAAPLAEHVVVQNRAHRQDRSWGAGLAAHGLPGAVARVPRDDRVASTCWSRARTPREVAPRSGLARALADVAERAVSP